MIKRFLSSERTKWIFVMGVVAIGAGFITRNVISYPTECMQQEMVKYFVLPNENTRNFFISQFFFLEKSKELLDLQNEIYKCFFKSFFAFAALRISSLKATSTLFLLLLIKTNLLRLKGGLIVGLVALTLISVLIVSTTSAGDAAYYIFPT